MNLLAALTAALALATPSGVADTKRAICVTFGRYCSQALRVAGCETGWTYSIYARNGDHLGLFQVSAQWRRDIPGFAYNAWAQSRHAYRVFARTGYSWRPWTCQP